MAAHSVPSEIVRIDVLAIDGAVTRCRNVVTRRILRLESDPQLVPGETLTVEIACSGMLSTLIRVVGAAQPPEPEQDAAPPEPPLLVNGRAFDMPTEVDLRVEIGDVRTAWIGFTAGHSAERDRGKRGKRRPVVVMAVDSTTQTAEVCPIHGANSAVRATGGARRLLGWRELGLRKSSVVASNRVVVPLAGIDDLIGRLDRQDQERLGLARSR